ncbi:MAG: DUF370 domain-containing protein [Oscillospiraceae bacterium]|jgi:hypothetical protein|nr:DUF370 domain-containing protein [Oscillospiraceae bacterium]
MDCYLHLGAQSLVLKNQIIGIFDLDSATVAMATRDFLASMQRGGAVRDAGEDLPKSFVLTQTKQGCVAALSPLNPSALLHRTRTDAAPNLLQGERHAN